MKPEDVILPTKEKIISEAKEALQSLRTIVFKLNNDMELGHETYLHITNLEFIIKKLTDDPTLRYSSFRKVYAAKMWLKALNFCPENKD